MNATSSTAGAWTPTPLTAATNPRVAASEYAGAVEATPITTLETYPMAPFFSPLSITPEPAACPDAAGGGGAATLSVAIGLLSGGGPRHGGPRRAQSSA